MKLVAIACRWKTGGVLRKVCFALDAVGVKKGGYLCPQVSIQRAGQHHSDDGNRQHRV